MNTRDNIKYKTHKEIVFDLDTNAMKSLGVYPNGYERIKQSMKRNGFLHRQGSAYISINPLSYKQSVNIVRKITISNPWLQQCISKIDLTSIIDKSFDLTNVVKETIISQKSNDKDDDKSK